MDAALAALFLIRAWLPAQQAIELHDELRAIAMRAGCERPVVAMRSMNRLIEIEVTCAPSPLAKPPEYGP